MAHKVLGSSSGRTNSDRSTRWNKQPVQSNVNSACEERSISRSYKYAQLISAIGEHAARECFSSSASGIRVQWSRERAVEGG